MKCCNVLMYRDDSCRGCLGFAVLGTALVLQSERSVALANTNPAQHRSATAFILHIIFPKYVECRWKET